MLGAWVENKGVVPLVNKIIINTLALRINTGEMVKGTQDQDDSLLVLNIFNNISDDLAPDFIFKLGFDEICTHQ